MSVLLSEPVQALVSINVLLTLSLLFPFVAGVWSLGMPGFMALGAYSASWFSATLGWPVAASLLAGTLIATLGTLPFGLLALRVRGIYLAIATLAAAELITLFFSHFSPTGGVLGFSGMPFVSAGWVVALAVAGFLVSIWIYRSRFGAVLIAVGSDPTVASCNALRVPLVQLTALALSGALAGLAGGLFAHHYSFIAPGNFGFHRTIDILLFLVAGGLTPLGAVFGSAVLTLVPQYAAFLQLWAPAFYAAVVIVIMALMPDGIWPRNRVKALLSHLKSNGQHHFTARKPNPAVEKAS